MALRRRRRPAKTRVASDASRRIIRGDRSGGADRETATENRGPEPVAPRTIPRPAAGVSRQGEPTDRPAAGRGAAAGVSPEGASEMERTS